MNLFLSFWFDPEADLLHEQFFSGLYIGVNTVCNNDVSFVKGMQDQDAA